MKKCLLAFALSTSLSGVALAQDKQMMIKNDSTKTAKVLVQCCPFQLRVVFCKNEQVLKTEFKHAVREYYYKYKAEEERALTFRTRSSAFTPSVVVWPFLKIEF